MQFQSFRIEKHRIDLVRDYVKGKTKISIFIAQAIDEKLIREGVDINKHIKEIKRS